MVCSTIREILVNAEEKFGSGDAIRYKVKKDVTEAKSYTQLKEDSERFSRVLEELGETGSHIAVTGMTSYPWIVSYLGTVNSGSVAVPLDSSLPAEEMCELIDRADATCLDMKIPERTVILSVLPIHHVYCLSMDILKGISLGSIICINESCIH